MLTIQALWIRIGLNADLDQLLTESGSRSREPTIADLSGCGSWSDLKGKGEFLHGKNLK
jgi:hypothetical protein